MSEYRIGVLVGSSRLHSYSQALAQAATKVAPASLSFCSVPIDELSFYNQDLENSGEIPEDWVELRMVLAECDGFLFVTPEYNRSIPAMLKNAVDVGSRPTSEKTWAGKPGVILSQSPGRTGGFGANHALRQALVYPNVILMNQPEGYFGEIATTIDEASGEIIDAHTLAFLERIMKAFADWVNQIAPLHQVR